jgi:hypothetical protein
VTPIGAQFCLGGVRQGDTRTESLLHSMVLDLRYCQRGPGNCVRLLLLLGEKKRFHRRAAGMLLLMLLLSVSPIDQEDNEYPEQRESQVPVVPSDTILKLQLALPLSASSNMYLNIPLQGRQVQGREAAVGSLFVLDAAMQHYRRHDLFITFGVWLTVKQTH